MSSTPPEEQSLLGRLTNIFGGSPTNLPRPEQDEEEGMARMSFLGHLEELRHRILMIVYGMVGAFCFALIFRNQMWDVVQKPATDVLKHLHVVPPELSQIGVMDVFQNTWMKQPHETTIFLA